MKSKTTKTEQARTPVFMTGEWSFHCHKNGQVIEIFKERGSEMYRIMIDDSTQELIVRVD
jgi:hypothetical protein